jgi:hypothetical protein
VPTYAENKKKSGSRPFKPQYTLGRRLRTGRAYNHKKHNKPGCVKDKNIAVFKMKNKRRLKGISLIKINYRDDKKIRKVKKYC